MAFSKSLQKGQIPVGCQLCEVGNKIDWKCTDCKLLMCDRCKTKVHVKIAKDHRIVNIREIGEVEDSWDSFSFSDLKCQDHSSQPCSLYCGTCSKVICLKCLIKVHNGHTFVDEEEFEEKKKKMKEGQMKAERNLSKLGYENEKRGASENEIENPKMKNIQQNILDQKMKVHKAVDHYADNLVQDVVQYFGTYEHEEKKKKDKEMKDIHLKKKALESIITSRDFTKFFRDFDKLNYSFNQELSQDTTNLFSLPKFVPGEFTMLNFGKLEGSKELKEHHFKVELRVINKWNTALTNVHNISVCPDGSLWIADNSIETLQQIMLSKQSNVNILYSIETLIAGIVVKSRDIILSTLNSRLQCIDGKTYKLTESVFNISPFEAGEIHITKDHKVIVAAMSPRFSTPKRSLLVVMDQAGHHLNEYEKDSNNKPLFTSAYTLTSTSKGHIFVVDNLCSDFRGRVVVIGQEGDIKGIYSGHHEVNTKDKPFMPINILATPSDNILVIDWKISVLHMLNSDGCFIAYFCVRDIGIQYPHSLALSTEGHLFIGSGGGEDSPPNFKAKLYEVEYSGI